MWYNLGRDCTTFPKTQHNQALLRTHNETHAKIQNNEENIMNQKKFPISTPQPRRSAHTSLNSHALLAESRTQARSSFWDLVRGIGILSIVMGHSCRQVIPYVYTYHLAVFFFVSGYLYNEKKYGLDPFGNIAAKLKSAWPNYMGYTTFYILKHNQFQKTGINAPGETYSRSRILMALGNAIVFQGAELMGGTLWFVPVWILACAVFGGIIWFTRRFCPDKAIGSIPARPLLAGAASCFFGLIGCFLILRGLPLSYQLHLVFLVQPFFAVGWLIRSLFPTFKKLLKWYLAFPCALGLAFFVGRWQLYIDLSLGRIGNGWQFFFLAFLGIYCCMYLAFLLEAFTSQPFSPVHENAALKKAAAILAPAIRLISLWGRYSFDIMAAHFFVFKLIDLLYGRFLMAHPLETYSGFPQAYAETLWPLYAILGTTLPALLGLALEKAGRHLPA